MLKAGHNSHGPQSVQVSGHDVKYITDFPYQGGMVTSDGWSDVDVESRIGKAAAAFFRLTKIWNSSSCRHKLKIKIMLMMMMTMKVYF